MEHRLSKKNQGPQASLDVWILTNASKIMDAIDLQIASIPLVKISLDMTHIFCDISEKFILFILFKDHMSVHVILVIMEMVEHVSRSMLV